MLHELLLSLSGHPSPLLKSGSQVLESLHPVLSPAELALLGSLAEDLGGKHKSIRDNTTAISASHTSAVCRAVASAIISIHLAKFQRRIIEVEKDILTDNAKIVGAYNIVPLSAVVGSFEGWPRKLEWLQDLVQFIQAPVSSAATRVADREEACTAAMLISRLRDSIHTGYPDIEEISTSLVQAAETAWLKQVSAWVLYGRHPGEEDFLITSGDANGNDSSPLDAYKIAEALLPPFVTLHAANSVLFVGKSLNHIRERQRSDVESSFSNTSPELALLPAHLAQLSSLKSPISAASFSAAIGAIRFSLSQNALQKLLPITKVLDLLYILKDFFLLDRGEFAVALITAADDRLNARNRREKMSNKTPSALEDNLAGLTIKEGEVHAVLTRTWAALASLRGDQDNEEVDEELDRARELIRLSIKSIDASGVQSRDHNREKATAFDDLLLPSSTALSVKVTSPLDLFFTIVDADIYSRIHAYLIAIRRAHLHLSKLFLLSKLRREYPCPRAPTHMDQKGRTDILERKRQLSNQRTRALRPAWARLGSATFFFAELSGYLQGEVIERSWSAFRSWLTPSITDRPNSSNGSFALSSTPAFPRPSSSSRLGSRPTSSRASNESARRCLYDPETLAQAHKSYLIALERSLLLDNVTFTRPLRRLMTATDHITALMQRLNTIQTNLDIETDPTSDPTSTATNTTSHYPAEEQQIMADLRTSLPRLSNGVQELVGVLRDIDNARTSDSSNSSKAPEPRTTPEEPPLTLEPSLNAPDTYTPWTSRSLDRLLLKFDYKNVEALNLS